jgi:hypothetical protein
MSPEPGLHALDPQHEGMTLPCLQCGRGTRSSQRAFLTTGKIVYTIGVMTKREEELLAAGWERRFIATEPRLREAIELYEEIGFEVLLEPLPTEEEMKGGGCEESGCAACFDVDRERYRIIYTRAKEARES